jgi:hypothetical protein
MPNSSRKRNNGRLLKLTQLLSKLSCKPITPITIRRKIGYSFGECEEFIRSFFPNAARRRISMFKTCYYVRDVNVGYVSLYSGTQYIARIGNETDEDDYD